MVTNKWYKNLPRVFSHFINEEIQRSTLLKTVSRSIKAKTFEMEQFETFAHLLERQATQFPVKPFIYFNNECFHFRAIHEETNRFVNFLKDLGMSGGSGLGIMMKNSPQFLISFYATQRLGMYAVPINTALVGEGLSYIINHSEIEALVLDSEFLLQLDAVLESCKNIKILIIRGELDENINRSIKNKPICVKFSDYLKYSTELRSKNEIIGVNKSVIMYTSGTTGLPKGVVLKYNTQLVRRLGLMNNLIYEPSDVLFTCLPLFHANALFISFSAALWLGLPIVLTEKFSASKFWPLIHQYNVTVFNTVGAMIPILLKNMEADVDSKNSVRLVLSAACPADSWAEFERRFQVEIWECYSAVDGGQNYVFNMGNAPIGSIGKIPKKKYKIIDDFGNECENGKPGELWFKLRSKEDRPVEYFKDEKATDAKFQEGYLKTGDLVYRDKKGYLYFVGRKTESMRRRGENVSAFEVEKVIQKHPDVLEVCVYAVPSPLGEDDIMAALIPVEGKLINAIELKNWLDGKLAKFAIPRYYRIMNEFPKTPTHRVIKKSIQDEGVTRDTIDLE